jgi:hypothetical protein
MSRSPDKIPKNIDFAAQELLEAPEAESSCHALGEWPRPLTSAHHRVAICGEHDTSWVRRQ